MTSPKHGSRTGAISLRWESFFGIDHQHGRLVTWLQTKNYRKFENELLIFGHGLILLAEFFKGTFLCLGKTQHVEYPIVRHLICLSDECACEFKRLRPPSPPEQFHTRSICDGLVIQLFRPHRFIALLSDQFMHQQHTPSKFY